MPIDMRFMFVLSILVMTFPHMATMLECFEGTYVHKFDDNRADVCTECPDGTVMPHKEHQNTSCIPCEKIKDSKLENLVSPCNKTHQAVIHCVDGYYRGPDYHGDHEHTQSSCRPCEKIKDPDLEILVSPCNKTHDAVIHCVDGYYRDEARNPRETRTCKKCTKCPRFTGRSCGTYRDTVCCWNENDDVVPNEHGVPKCIERPWFCRPGQYFDPKAYYCEKCPKNTFMNLDYHIQQGCLQCTESKPYRPLHSVIVQPCNSTHAPVIRCEDGFFIKPNMGYKDGATGCSPCTDCSTKNDVQYEGRKCDGMEDTVCCPQANMTVIDTFDGPMCTTSSTSCGDGQCLQYNVKRKSSTCTPCSPRNDDDNSYKSVEAINPSAGLPVANQGTLLDHLLNVSIKVDDQTSNSGFPSGVLFLGILIGVVATVALYYICRVFLKRCLHRILTAKNRPPRFVLTELGEPGVEDPLQEIHLKIENPKNVRSRLASAFHGGAEHLRNRLGGSHMRLTTDDDDDLVQCCGDESDLHSNAELCSSDHANSISIGNFAVQHLPKGFRNDEKMAYVKAVCDLTVRLKVNHTSNARPKGYPCSVLAGSFGAGIKRFGTGLVFKVTKRFKENNNSTCPCRYCSVYHNRATKKWAEFAVVTAAHIVFDDDECKRTSCRLWFDNDEDFVRAPSLKGRSVEGLNKSEDFRILHCVTHCQKTSLKLEEKVACFQELLHRHRKIAKSNIEGEKLAVLISQQHGLSKKISVGKAEVKMDNGKRIWSYDIQTCPGSCGAPVCLLSKSQGSGILSTIHGLENVSTGLDFDQLEF